MPALTG